MRIKLIIISIVVCLIGIGAQAEASWVMVPPEGYGCPPGFEIVTVDTQTGSLTVCIPGTAPAPPPEETAPVESWPEEGPYFESTA